MEFLYIYFQRFLSMPLELIFFCATVRKLHPFSYQLIASILNLVSPIYPILKRIKSHLEHMVSQYPSHIEK